MAETSVILGFALSAEAAIYHAMRLERALAIYVGLEAENKDMILEAAQDYKTLAVGFELACNSFGVDFADVVQGLPGMPGGPGLEDMSLLTDVLASMFTSDNPLVESEVQESAAFFVSEIRQIVSGLEGPQKAHLN